MDASDLRWMEAVARHGSMNKAAAELNTVQSNITARIRTLEEEIGAPLFERHSRGVTLTPAGRRLLPYAARIGQLLKEAKAAARDDGAPQGRLHLGTLETTAALRLPPILSSYAQAYPQVDLTVTTGTTCSLIADVVEGRLEGAFVAGPVRDDELVGTNVFQEELVLLTARSIASLADLDRVRDLKIIVFRLGCSYRQRLEDWLARRGLKTARPLEFGSLDAILGCVAAGVGVTLLPKAVAAEALREGRIAMHALPPDLAHVDTMFVRRVGAYVSSAQAAFVAMARAAPQRALAAE
jgi:LysR family transcriptional regulator, cell division regulator